MKLGVHQLKDMRTLQEIATEATKYQFIQFNSKLEQIEYLVENTKKEMSLFQRNHQAKCFTFYLAAADEITAYIVEATAPYISLILTEAELKDVSIERCTELQHLLERVKHVLNGVYTYEKFWILEEKYISILRRATACQYALDGHIQHINIVSVSS